MAITDRNPLYALAIHRLVQVDVSSKNEELSLVKIILLVHLIRQLCQMFWLADLIRLYKRTATFVSLSIVVPCRYIAELCRYSKGAQWGKEP